MMYEIDPRKFSEYFVYIPEYNVTLMKLPNGKYIQFPNVIRYTEDLSSYQNVYVTKYYFMLYKKLEEHQNEEFKILKLEAYMRKININIKLIQNIYKVIAIEYDNKMYPILILMKNETVDKELLKRIIEKFKSLENKELKHLFLDRISKVAYNSIEINKTLTKELKIRKVKINTNTNNKIENEELIETEELVNTEEDLFVDI